jgi:uncharacterized protein (TIGR00255 family)
MKSMTGYGKSVVQINNMDISIEIRSVNNRFLDISMKMPKELNDYEYDLRKLIKKRLNRGKINVYINLNEGGGDNAEAAVDMERAELRYAQLKKLKKELGITGEISLDHLLSFNDLFEPGLQSVDADLMKKTLLKALDMALEQFEAMREAEGGNLLTDMQNRISKIHEWTKFVKENGRNNIQKEFERLKNNVFSLIDTGKIDKNRLEAELALISDKVDVTEECVRMDSHIQLFNETLNNKGEAGKKLTFILQEMLREANTMNSKTTDTNIAHKVIRIKEEIEKIREQAQNVE